MHVLETGCLTYTASQAHYCTPTGESVGACVERVSSSRFRPCVLVQPKSHVPVPWSIDAPCVFTPGTQVLWQSAYHAPTPERHSLCVTSTAIVDTLAGVHVRCLVCARTSVYGLTAFIVVDAVRCTGTRWTCPQHFCSCCRQTTRRSLHARWTCSSA